MRMHVHVLRWPWRRLLTATVPQSSWMFLACCIWREHCGRWTWPSLSSQNSSYWCAASTKCTWTKPLSVLCMSFSSVFFLLYMNRHVNCGCNISKLILKSFGPVIKNNLLAPPQGNRDIQREERYIYLSGYNDNAHFPLMSVPSPLRYEKCLSCQGHLKSLREEVVRIVREDASSSAAKVIRERALLTAFTVLD